MNKVDVTLPVLIDVAVLEYESATDHVMKKLGISSYLAEIALEKALLNMKNNRMKLYASALYQSNSPENGGNHDGNKNN